MTRERYESISLHDLREIAKNRGMRRISTLKKADLIDAMLKKDEEEAIILRNERIQRRQMQEAAQEAAARETAQAQEEGGKAAAAAEAKSPEEAVDSASGTQSPENTSAEPFAADTEKEDKAGRSGKKAGRSRRENAGPDEVRTEETNRDQKSAEEEGSQNDQASQNRQRNQGGQRNRQGTVSYNTGSQTGRRQVSRPRRDDRLNNQNGRQARPIRQNSQNGQAGYGQGQDRNRPAESGRERVRGPEQNPERNGAGFAQAERGQLPEQIQERGRSTNASSQERVREQYSDMRMESAQNSAIPANSYVQAPSEIAGMTAREQSPMYQNIQSARQTEAGRQGMQGAGQTQVYQDGTQETAGTRLSRYYQPGRPDTPVLHKDELNTELDSGQMANGILEVMQDGFGFIRCANYMPGENDIYVAPSQIRRFGLKTGDIIVGNIRVRTQGEKFSALLYVKSVNGFSPDEATKRYNFEDMTPVFPDERIRLERSGGPVSMRIMDLISPVGKGQRGMIVSPPKAGKTTLLKEIARSVKYNNPEIHLIVLLIDERPEEVTDIREAIEGPNAEVIYSTFDELPEHHKRVSEMAIERARRLVEHKKDVMILLDSITRLTRAYNITEPSSGRTLSGGLDPAALHMPKRFFGAARNMREGGSLTILATALIDTGSKMDDIVFEEFKGTGNMELVLDRRLSERRIFPAIDIVRSGTRRDDLLLTPDEQNAMGTIRRSFNGLSAEQTVTQALDLFSKTRTNGEFVNMVRKLQWTSVPERLQ